MARNRMNPDNVHVDRYAGDNLRIEGLLSLTPLEDNEVIFRVNGPRGIRMMIMSNDSTEAAVKKEYITRYDTVVIEEEVD